MKKTNALRLLDAAKIDYTAREYDVSDGEISGVAVAIKIGQEPERLFKTLVALGKSTGLNVFVVPSSAPRLIQEKSPISLWNRAFLMLNMISLWTLILPERPTAVHHRVIIVISAANAQRLGSYSGLCTAAARFV